MIRRQPDAAALAEYKAAESDLGKFSKHAAFAVILGLQRLPVEQMQGHVDRAMAPAFEKPLGILNLDLVFEESRREEIFYPDEVIPRVSWLNFEALRKEIMRMNAPLIFEHLNRALKDPWV